ncbi:MAG: Uma2 family endonuclease [Actinomycetota bacterium]
MTVKVKPWSFTVDDYQAMGAAGILAEDDRVELIDGVIAEMTPIGARHVSCLMRLNAALTIPLDGRALVSIQGSVRLSERSEPQPDVAVVRMDRDYSTQLPGPADILLLIEVADTSLGYDQAIKLPLYARAGVDELWIIDLAGQRINRYRSPEGDGYDDVATLGPGETVMPLAFPDVAIQVGSLF